MATFFTRVELHGIHHNSEAYGLLHIEMQNRSFLQSVSYASGWLKLPPAEYYRTAAGLTKEIVLADAKAAATEATKSVPLVFGKKHKYAILVVQTNDYASFGLEPREGSSTHNAEMNRLIRC